MPSRTPSHTSQHDTVSRPSDQERTPLLRHSNSTQSQSRAYHRPSCQQQECEHGALSPHASRPNSSSSVSPPNPNIDAAAHTPTHMGSDYAPQTSDPHRLSPDSYGGRYGGEQDLRHGVLGDAVADGVLGDGTGDDLGGQGNGADEEDDGDGKQKLKGIVSGMSTTQWLARKHGVKGRRTMYLAYYLPFLNWIMQYRWSYLQGDLIAALTMASFYIPMSLSYASNLGHIPPINGLYSFVFNPLIYAFLGSCPQMVVGPEAAGSLLVGTVVRSSVDQGHIGDDDDAMNAAVAGVVTGMAGAVIFVAGLTRLGFLDSVLSRPFLRGFISAIGFVIVVDQLIPEMGLSKKAKHTEGIGHGSSLEKVIFLIENVTHVHGLTCGVAFGSFAIIMLCR